MTDPGTPTKARWLTPGVGGISAASFLADVGHEIPTALLPNLLTATLGAPAAALGLIEGLSDGLAGVARLAPLRRAAGSATPRLRPLRGRPTMLMPLATVLKAQHERMAGWYAQQGPMRPVRG